MGLNTLQMTLAILPD